MRSPPSKAQHPPRWLWTVPVSPTLPPKRCTSASVHSTEPNSGSSAWASPPPAVTPPWRLRQCAQRKLGLRREQPQRALEAGREAGQDDARVALEALGAAVHHGLDGGHVGGAILLELCEGLQGVFGESGRGGQGLCGWPWCRSSVWVRVGCHRREVRQKSEMVRPGHDGEGKRSERAQWPQGRCARQRVDVGSEGGWVHMNQGPFSRPPCPGTPPLSPRKLQTTEFM